MNLYPPLKNMSISQRFGVNPQSYIKFGDYGHNGIDIPASEGTDLFSPITGEITEVNWHPTGYGLFYRIKNSFFEVITAHLKENYLPIGSKVTAGQLIGKTGNTGNSSGPHLHFGVRIAGMSNPQISNYSDPVWYLNNEDPDISRLQKELDKCRENDDTKTDQIEKLLGQISESKHALERVEGERNTFRKERDQALQDLHSAINGGDSGNNGPGPDPIQPSTPDLGKPVVSKPSGVLPQTPPAQEIQPDALVELIKKIWNHIKTFFLRAL